MKFCLIFLITISCSFKSILVTNLDYILTSKISDNFDLEDGQEEILREDIKRFLGQNKPLANKIKINILAFSLENINALKLLRNDYIEITKKMTPLISKHYNLLTKNQKNSLLKRERVKNLEIIKKNKEMTPKSIGKKYSNILGYINEKQKLIIKKNFTMTVEMSAERVNRRINIQNKLSEAEDIKQIEDAFKIYSLSLENDSKYKEKIFIYFKEIIESSNNDQKKAILNKKNEIIEFVDLIIKEEY